jgi:putative NADPH-quinone reductase
VTLILFFHPDPPSSRANAALARAARSVAGTRIIDMKARYPDNSIAIDAAREARELLAAERIVLQFPIQWYSTPPLMKAWQDAVLTRMFYINAASEGDRLVGTPLMLAVTAGNSHESYSRAGQNHFTLDEVLTPLKATAHRCGLPWQRPFVLYRANQADDAALRAAGEHYAAALREFAAADSRTAVLP